MQFAVSPQPYINLIKYRFLLVAFHAEMFISVDYSLIPVVWLLGFEKSNNKGKYLTVKSSWVFESVAYFYLWVSYRLRRYKRSLETKLCAYTGLYLFFESVRLNSKSLANILLTLYRLTSIRECSMSQILTGKRYLEPNLI